jgi:hypothetical protein
MVQTTFTMTDGNAAWYHVLIMSRMPPTMFSTRYDVAVPAIRPTEASAYGTTTHTAPSHPSASANASENDGEKVTPGKCTTAGVGRECGGHVVRNLLPCRLNSQSQPRR